MNKHSIRMMLLALLLSVGMSASISYANAAKQTPDSGAAMKAQTKPGQAGRHQLAPTPTL